MPRTLLSYFGRVVWVMMATRGITGYADLSVLLRGSGHDFSDDVLRNWLTGRTSVHKTFSPALAEVLRLDDEERARLADVFTYHQDEKL